MKKEKEWGGYKEQMPHAKDKHSEITQDKKPAERVHFRPHLEAACEHLEKQPK